MEAESVRLAIVTTHPVQYNAPLFELLTARGKMELKIFYTWGQAKREVFDPGFGHNRQWDIPLLQNYSYLFVENISKQPGSHHFGGIVNPTLITEICSWEPDVLLVFGWCFHSHLKCLQYFKGRLPVLFRGDSTLVDVQPFLRSFPRKLLLRWVYQNVDLAFFVGANNKRYFQEFGLKEEQLVYAPHAVDNRRFAQISLTEEAEAMQWRKDLGFSEYDWLLLFVGKFEEKKNPFFILKLAEQISEENIKFLMVGNGQLEDQLKKDAKDNRIVFLNFQNQSKMPLVYRLGQALILPSKGPGETWGLVANEAMCAGLPIILSSKVGGAPDLVHNGENGLIFHSDEVEKVASYIRHLYNNKEACLQAGRNAIRHIQQFSLDALAETIESTTHAVAKKTGMCKFLPLNHKTRKV